MIKGFMGTKELQQSVSEIKGELPVIQYEIIKQIQQDVKSELSNAMQAQEMRMKETITELFKEFKSEQTPEKVVHAIKADEQESLRNIEREEISKQLSLIYSLSNGSTLVTDDGKVNDVLTDTGERVYDLIANTVLRLAKYNGSKSHNKIANHTTYSLFENYAEEKEAFEKVTLVTREGLYRKSVYSDIISRGRADKFAKFIEGMFLTNEKETII